MFVNGIECFLTSFEMFSCLKMVQVFYYLVHLGQFVGDSQVQIFRLYTDLKPKFLLSEANLTCLMSNKLITL
jgi:hypothetical protein